MTYQSTARRHATSWCEHAPSHAVAFADPEPDPEPPEPDDPDFDDPSFDGPSFDDPDFDDPSFELDELEESDDPDDSELALDDSELELDDSDFEPAPELAEDFEVEDRLSVL